MTDTYNFELKTFKKVIARLEQAGIPYMLTGSMAMNLYGHPRATNDFDIVIEVQSRDAERLFDFFKEDYYISLDAVRQALNTDGMFNIIDNESVFKVDLISRKSDAYAIEQFKRRQIKEFAGCSVAVISPEDLVLAKLNWSQGHVSELQERDIGNMLRLLSGTLDEAYMEKWAGVLGTLPRLKKLYVAK